jgi:DNA repair exonuclease SbcCD nuclease subunit
MKYLIVGDLHLKEKLGYADYIQDGRQDEKQEVLDRIFNLSKGCQKVVFMGDQLNGRNNPSEVIKEFVKYIERFKQEIFIIAGNHEKVGDGKSAIDFLKEVKNKNWHIITNEVVEIDGDVFCPYFYKGELGCKTNQEGAEKLLKMLPKGKNLFMHHAASGFNLKAIRTDDLNEIVLPKKELSKKYDNIFLGHIHLSYVDVKANIVYTGSVFTNEVNEGEKFVYTFDGKLKTKEHQLPVRQIVKLEDPEFKDFEKYTRDSILKVILTKLPTDTGLEKIKSLLSGYDGGILIEDYRIERKVLKFADGDLDLDIMNLIKIYAETKKLDFEKLKAGYELIK